jgi:WD40 repeat protein
MVISSFGIQQMAPCSCVFFCRNDNVLSVSDVVTQRKFTGHLGDVNACAFLQSDDVLASAGDFRVMLWRVRDGACTATLAGHTAGAS